MVKAILLAVCRICLVLTLVLAGVWIFFAQPSPFSHGSPSDVAVDENRMVEVVRQLSEDFHPRNFRELDNLDSAAKLIARHFEKSGGRVEVQGFEVNGLAYQNVRAYFGEGAGARIIVGAHYDAYSQTPGADDNASGVAGLIELAYLLGRQERPPNVELVAYSLEEPPFFGTEAMGSYFHARQTRESGVEVRGVIILEMIGFFSDEPHSQDYPSRLFHLLYPTKGNFIAVVGSLGQRAFIADIKSGMKGSAPLPVYSVSAPIQIPGVDFSDHRNYWKFGYDAVMITDTAFYRNQAYHTSEDTWDRLDYTRMAYVVEAVHSAIRRIAE